MVHSIETVAEQLYSLAKIYGKEEVTSTHDLDGEGSDRVCHRETRTIFKISNAEFEFLAEDAVVIKSHGTFSSGGMNCLSSRVTYSVGGKTLISVSKFDREDYVDNLSDEIKLSGSDWKVVFIEEHKDLSALLAELTEKLKSISKPVA